MWRRMRRGYGRLNEIKWNDRFNIGVEIVDKAHQRLFSIVRKLLSLNEDTMKQQHACREGVKYFKSYTLKHFAEEEAYMKSIDYPEYEIHKKLHDDMKFNTIPALEAELESQNYSMESVQHFIGMCVGWLNGHIMIEDRAITGNISNKWVHQPSQDEMASIEKAVNQGMDSLFGVKPQAISKHYSGEDFSSGRALGFRLTYLSPEGKRRRVFLVYEEQMVLSMLGEMLGKHIKKMDKTVLYAMKALSQKLMDLVKLHFPITEGYELEKTDIMTFEQFARMFSMDKQYPPYSLLFSTEKNGYFVFCVK